MKCICSVLERAEGHSMPLSRATVGTHMMLHHERVVGTYTKLSE